jgi:predicted dehydrogenase
MRIGLVGVDGSHAEDFLRLFNIEGRHNQMRISAIWGGTPERTQELLALAPNVNAAPALDALIAEVDAVIVGDRHGGLHRAQALPCIAAGLPVFIDKPLANVPADAKAIIDIASAAGVPVASGSALRWQAETVALKSRIASMQGPVTLSAYGTWYPDNEYGGAIYYAIHTLELAQELVGPAWSDVRVERGNAPIVRYRAGDNDVVLNLRPLGESGSSAFGVTIAAGDTSSEHPIPLGDDYMAPVAEKIAALFSTRRSPMTAEELLAPVTLMAEIDRLLR